MPRPTALRRLTIGCTAGAGVALLGFAVHGMAGLDARLAAIAQARDAAQTRLVVEKGRDARDCDKVDAAQLDGERTSPAAPSERDY